MNRVEVRNHLITTLLSCVTSTPEYVEGNRLHAEFVATKLLNSGATVLPKKCILTETTVHGDMHYILNVVEHRFIHGVLHEVVVEDHRGVRNIVSLTEFESGRMQFIPNAIT